MRTAKVFKCGNSQAVRLPKDLQFKNSEVEILSRNNEIIIREIPKNLTKAFELLTQLPNDFFAKGRKDKLPQKRNFFE